MRRVSERRRGALTIVVSGGFAALLTAVSAAAAPAPTASQAAIGWSTYLRAGPDQTSEAIAELEHDTAVTVLGCSGQWCRVSRGNGQGYVDRDALFLPRTLAPVPPANRDCVVVGQVDNRGPIPTRFCSAQPAAR